jgi:ATP-dependent exoDNAse (exonuclease V) alpha subunit
MTQEEAFEILKTGSNVFLTGQAGSGKTFVLNKYIEYLKSKNIRVAVTASTGIAASHIGGKTIHSWAGIGIKDSMTKKELRNLLWNENLRERIEKTKVLIIDEISMLHSFRLDLAQKVIQMMKQNSEPFGGMQVILCGDFFQLPPVSRNGNPMDFFAFRSKAWTDMNLKVCYLETQYRQTDVIYSSILNDIREDRVNIKTVSILNTRKNAEIKDKSLTRLYTHNIDVDAINDAELSKLPGKEVSYEMSYGGDLKSADELRRNCLAPENLFLKKGAMVMFVRNNFEEGFVNGTLGVVNDFDEDGLPVVKIKNGDLITVKPEKWVFEENGEIAAYIGQIPLRLAWAITIHKSQGMSLDAAEVDLSKAFETGMGYVALSRIRTLNGLRLVGLNETAFKVHPEILLQDRMFFESSAREVSTIKKLLTVKVRRLSRRKISNCKIKNERL